MDAKDFVAHFFPQLRAAPHWLSISHSATFGETMFFEPFQRTYGLVQRHAASLLLSGHIFTEHSVLPLLNLPVSHLRLFSASGIAGVQSGQQRRDAFSL